MPGKKPPRDCVGLLAIDPNTGKTWQLLLRHALMDWTAKRGTGPALELGYTVPWALLHPTAIFRGLREEGEQEWLCYASLPTEAYHYRTGQQRPAWPGQVFLVFVDDDHIIYTWRWEPADPNDPRLPENYTTRFDERVL
jgi:hypothetical protein